MILEDTGRKRQARALRDRAKKLGCKVGRLPYAFPPTLSQAVCFPTSLRTLSLTIRTLLGITCTALSTARLQKHEA